MKANFIAILWLGVIITGLSILSAFTMVTEASGQHHRGVSMSTDTFKKQACFKLDLKCNECHRWQNLFMVFNEKMSTKGQERSTGWYLKNGECQMEMKSAWRMKSITNLKNVLKTQEIY